MEKKDFSPEEVFKEMLSEEHAKDMLSVCRSDVRGRILEVVACAIRNINDMDNIDRIKAYRVSVMQILAYLLYGEAPPVWNSTYYRCQGAVDSVIVKKVLALKAGLDKSQLQ